MLQLTACGGNAGVATGSDTALSPNNLAATATVSASQSVVPGEYIEALAKWQAADIHNYSFSYKEGGGYKFAVYQYQTVVVTADKVVSINGMAVAADDDSYQRLTIANLFIQLNKQYFHAQTEAGRLDIVGANFDEILGFPTLINSGRNECCEQDHQLAITDLTILP